jgi:hypothetical protein
MSGQRHAPAALGKDLGTHWIGVWVASGLVWTQRLEEKILCLCRELNQVIHSVVRHYTD